VQTQTYWLSTALFAWRREWRWRLRHRWRVAGLLGHEHSLNASIAAVLRMYLGRAKTEIEGEPKGHKGELHREGCDFEVEISWQGWRISLVGPGLNPKN